ncbi:helix-turn-helix domain-containing protein [Desulfotruncus alcoholivorax]|uniref:helix-turn-helix domain-containing protein n=1 Tax=Desulfotruncus alcoholivorax TaxID=265477 RepID=UPI0004244955|nr:helix-turn-helix domain-containing protein [Desulfotruncus alcoholivorax]
MSANEIILKALKASKEPLKAGDIAEITGIDKKEVDKAIKALKNEGKIITPKRCYYSISE